jgi:hypothetical protein
MGGVGELPHTMIGASKDVMIYLWAKEMRITDTVNDAAHVLDFPKSDLTRQIANSIMASDQVDEFTAFSKKWMEDSARHLHAFNARRTGSVSVGDMHYEFVTERRVRRVLSQSSRVNEVALELKSGISLLLKARKSQPRVKDYLQTEFEWLGRFRFIREDPLPRKKDIPSVIGRHPSLERFELTLGFSTAANDQRKHTSKLFRMLNSPGFSITSEFDQDALMRLFTRPDVFLNRQKMVNAAVQLGAPSVNAQAFVEEFVKGFETAIVHGDGQRFSTGDEFGVTLDLTYRNLPHFVTIPPHITANEVLYLLRQVAVMYLLTTPIGAPLHHIRVEALGDAQEHFLDKFLKGSKRESPYYLASVPLNDWY